MRSRWDWVGAVTGALGVILGIVSIALMGDPPNAGDGSQEVVSWYADNKSEVEISSGVGLLGIALLVFFYAYVRRVLRQAEGEGGTLSVLAVVGAAVLGVGLAIETTISFAIAQAVDDDVDPTAILAMQALRDNDFFPIALGAVLMMVAVGLSVIRHGGLPTWLGWVALVLGVLAATPLGFIGVLGMLVWTLVVSLLLTARARGATPAELPATTRV